MTIKLVQRIESVTTKICTYLLVVMSVIVVVQVFSRYLFNYSFVWAEELVRYLMIWMVMIGSALVQSKNDHIRIDFFPRLAGPRGRRIMETVFRLCTLVFLTIIIYKGVQASYFNRLFESSGLRISMFWPSLAIPFGGILIGAYTAASLVQDLYRLFSWSKERLDTMDRRLAQEKYESEPMDQDKDRRQEG
jgi:TRAP-type C4-dicarboxylate transport system permease small subunit